MTFRTRYTRAFCITLSLIVNVQLCFLSPCTHTHTDFPCRRCFVAASNRRRSRFLALAPPALRLCRIFAFDFLPFVCRLSRRIFIICYLRFRAAELFYTHRGLLFSLVRCWCRERALLHQNILTLLCIDRDGVLVSRPNKIITVCSGPSRVRLQLCA